MRHASAAGGLWFVQGFNSNSLARVAPQCGKFQPLEDFDGDKRSCRARLDKHNARRRRQREMAHMLKKTGTIDEKVRLLGDALSWPGVGAGAAAATVGAAAAAADADADAAAAAALCTRIGICPAAFLLLLALTAARCAPHVSLPTAAD